MLSRRIALRALAFAPVVALTGCEETVAPPTKGDEADEANRRSAEAILNHQKSPRQGDRGHSKR